MPTFSLAFAQGQGHVRLALRKGKLQIGGVVVDDADQTMIMANYALNALWILLPLVPAVLIYVIFPKSQASAKGLFAGLTIRGGGAFAAYFIVLLASYPVLDG